MAKKIGLSLLVVIAIAAIAFFALAPKLTEESMNIVDGKPLPEIRADARALHETLTIVDLHSDSLLWKRDITQRADRGHVDLPRLQDGNVALQVFSSVTKTPKGQNYDNNSADGDNITTLVIAQMQPLRTWGSLLERSLYHAEKLDDAAGSTINALQKIETARGLTKLIEARKCGDCIGISNTKYASTGAGKPVGALFFRRRATQLGRQAGEFGQAI